MVSTNAIAGWRGLEAADRDPEATGAGSGSGRSNNCLKAPGCDAGCDGEGRLPEERKHRRKCNRANPPERGVHQGGEAGVYGRGLPTSQHGLTKHPPTTLREAELNYTLKAQLTR